MGRWKVGTIHGFLGSWGSGIAYLVIDGRAIPCENTATVRALDNLFGGFTAPGRVVHVEAIVGKRIAYKTDDFGLLDGLAPVEMVDELDEWEAAESE